MKLTRYEQSAFVLQTVEGVRIAIDFGHEVPSATVNGCRPIHRAFVSHEHSDHMHPMHLTDLGAPVCAPPDVVAQLGGSGLALSPVTAGSRITVGDLTVEFFNVDHGPGLSAPVENLGMTFRSHNTRLLFLGDMAVASDVPTGPWDAILVPVGGGKVFTPGDATKFVRSLGHTGLVIPVHYHGRADRSSGNQFQKEAASFCNVLLLDVGAEVDL